VYDKHFSVVSKVPGETVHLQGAKAQDGPEGQMKM
jgi:hypothetical protein